MPNIAAGPVTSIAVPSGAPGPFAISAPAGVVAGSVLCAIMLSDYSANPALMGAPNASWAQAGATGYQPLVGYGKVWLYTAGPAEPSSYSFNVPSSSGVLFLLRIDNAASVANVEMMGWNGETYPGQTAQVAPSIVIDSSDTLMITIFGGSAGTPPTYSGISGPQTIAAQIASTFAYGCVGTEQRPSPGSSGTRTATASTSHPYISAALAVLAADSVLIAAGGETVQFISPMGDIRSLNVEWATKGRFSPQVIFETDGVPEQSGLRLRNVRHDARDFVLPLWIAGSSEADLRTRMRDLVSVMNPTLGDGRIRYLSPVGDYREIYCRYSGGLDADETLGSTSGPTFQTFPVTFRAFDPYYYDVSDTVFFYAGAVPSSFFPFFPLRLSASEVFADVTVQNSGDAIAWPVWVVTGPCTGIVFQNLTTGKTLTFLTTVLLAGQTVTIDTRPGVKSVLREDGTNIFPDISALSSLWSLAQDANAVRIQLVGTTGASSVQLNYKNRSLTP